MDAPGRIALVLSLVTVVAGPVIAQCPDGSPPPCGQERRSVKIDSKAVVLLPFAVRGPSDLQYISEGMADLLRSAVDGIGEFRVVQPPASRRELLQPATPQAVAPAVRSLGARFVVTGSVVATGPELRVAAEMYDAVGGRRAKQVAVRTDLANLGRTADSIAVVLFAGESQTVRDIGLRAGSSLISAGRVGAREEILLTDFGSSVGDTTLARIAAEAVRVGLQQSGVVRVVSSERAVSAQQRMRSDTTGRLTLRAAREIAAREGVALIADGDVVRGRDGMLLTVRLVAADSGTTLVVRHSRVDDETRLMEAAEQVTRRLRSDIGESFRDVRASPRLEEVTTSSLEALRLYTEAEHAQLREGNNDKARRFLEQALALDSTFAAAWRKLTVVSGPSGPPDAIDKAFRFRAHATPVERLVIEGTYYTVRGGPRQAEAAYLALADLEGSPSTNLAFINMRLRQFARADSFYRAVIVRYPENAPAYEGLISTLLLLRNGDAADSVAALARQRLPKAPGITLRAMLVSCFRERYTECERGLDSLAASAPPSYSRAALTNLFNLARMRGQIARAEQLFLKDTRAMSDNVRATVALLHRAEIDIAIRHQPKVALQRLDSLGFVPPGGTDFMPWVASLYAQAGNPVSARRILAMWNAAVPDTARAESQLANLRATEADVAIAEGRVPEAIADIMAADKVGDAPRGPDAELLPLAMARVYERAAQADSAIAWYERFLKAPRRPVSVIDALWLGHVYERLSMLHEAKGNASAAAQSLQKFIDLWAEADQELQPRVAAARERLKSLGQRT
jgi:TolB-like protein/tetratricopeptide (TPR) repeat protein